MNNKVNIDINDMLQAVIQQRNSLADTVVQLQAIIAAKDREILKIKDEKHALTQDVAA